MRAALSGPLIDVYGMVALYGVRHPESPRQFFVERELFGRTASEVFAVGLLRPALVSAFDSVQLRSPRIAALWRPRTCYGEPWQHSMV
jgi:hypothetical protein